jgi:AcrR family transcriptional regulator
MSDVKAKPGQARRDRANATRRKLVDVAYSLFCQQGYAQTTMESIAAEADVAVQTVYYVFGTKAGLLREVIETAAAGQPDPPPVAQRSWMQQALATEDGHRALATAIEHGVDIYARVAPLGPTIKTAAASDPDIDAYWRRITDGRRAGMGQFIASLAEHGQLQAGLDPQRATDLLFVIYSHETFLGLTQDADWAIAEYKAWLYKTLSHQLITPRGRRAKATQGLSYHDLLNPR